MKSSQFIKRIRNYSLISFLLPLITINLCLFIYQILGNHLYPNYDWSEEKKYSPKEFLFIKGHYKSHTLSNCPIHKYSRHYITDDNQVLFDEDVEEFLSIYPSSEDMEVLEKLKVESVLHKFNNTRNNQCVKNNKLAYLLLNNFNSLEKILLDVKTNYKTGFGEVKNPYLYGEVSISRTARYFPANLIFKPLIVLSSIFLFFYWLNNLNLFKELINSNIQNKSIKKFFYLGVLSCTFLILHALFLGVDLDSNLFVKMRRLIIVLFIIFEVSAQIFLTRSLFKFKKELKNYIYPTILKIKIIFVITILLITVIVAVLLIWADLSSSFKHTLEWNYFSVLLVYYFLSRLLWRAQKNQKF